MADNTEEKKRRLLLFTLTNLQHMLDKGNLAYVRHYEAWFDEVHVVYLLGGNTPVRVGSTLLVPLGLGIAWLDLIVAPVRLFRYAGKEKPTHYLTADIIFSWWTGFLLRWLKRAKIVLMPVCMPNEIYKSTGRSLTGLPVPVERVLTHFCFLSAYRIIMSRNAQAQIDWLRSSPGSARKLKIVRLTVEEYPPMHFYGSRKQQQEAGKRAGESRVFLLYVGRLHPEKHAIDLVEMMAVLHDREIDAELHIAGDGVDRGRIELRIAQLGLQESVELHGFVASERLPALYARADLFVSTLTGTALREAGLMGVPIVAYDMDWVSKLLRDGETGFLAQAGDPVSLADKVEEAIRNPGLRARVALAFWREAHRRWPLEEIPMGLEEALGDLA